MPLYIPVTTIDQQSVAQRIMTLTDLNNNLSQNTNSDATVNTAILL